MRNAVVTPEGHRMRWVELPGEESARVYVHGLGATSPAYFARAAAHPLLAGRRSLLVDLLGHGISDRPADFDYTLEAHADALAAALTAAEVSGAELVAHSMGGSVAVVLAARHPHLVSRLVLVDANLDPVRPLPGAGGSAGIAAHTEEEFLAGGWEEVRDRAGAHWWSTMRLAGREAVHRSAVHLARGTVPGIRELLLGMTIPRTFLWPEADGPLPGAEELAEAGVALVPVPDCGHNIMLDAPEAFARLTAAALTDPDPEPEPDAEPSYGTGTGGLTVRAARPGDFEAVVAVADDWWGRPMAGVLQRLFVDHFFASSLVAEEADGTLAGFVFGFLSPSRPDEAYIHFTGVAPAHRRSGLARGLYERFFALARRGGRTVVKAITSPQNARSIAFHTALGFTVSEPVPGYDGPSLDRVVFRRPL